MDLEKFFSGFVRLFEFVVALPTEKLLHIALFILVVAVALTLVLLVVWMVISALKKLVDSLGKIIESLADTAKTAITSIAGIVKSLIEKLIIVIGVGNHVNSHNVSINAPNEDDGRSEPK